jgi:2-desacetyl-2-hydroxyethyl bacteriochlorophyllide A dehydrogenase
MKAAVFNKVNDLTLQERPIPEIGPGEALIKVKCIGICGTDVHVLQGNHATAVYPVIPGHELVGEIAEINGKTSETFKSGDLVVAQEVINCGVCDACFKGSDNVCEQLKILGIHTDGGFAEYVKVLADKLVKLPNDIDIELAAMIEPLAVAVHDVRRSGLKAGEDVLIIGGGPIGLLNALVCRLSGAGLIVISEPSENRRKFAEEMGFVTIDPLAEGFEVKLKEFTGGHGFDVSFEAAGAPDALNVCIRNTKPSGGVVIIAIASKPYPIDTAEVFFRELTLYGVRIHTMYDFKSAASMVAGGKLNADLRRMISKVFTLDEVVAAFEYVMTDREAFKTLVRI